MQQRPEQGLGEAEARTRRAASEGPRKWARLAERAHAETCGSASHRDRAEDALGHTAGRELTRSNTGRHLLSRANAEVSWLKSYTSPVPLSTSRETLAERGTGTGTDTSRARGDLKGLGKWKEAGETPRCAGVGTAAGR